MMFSLLLTLTVQLHALSNSDPALDSQWNSVVQIVTDGKDPDNSIVNSYCVATFLNPQTLVTAAHCLSHAHLIPSNRVRIELGQYEYRKRPDGSTFRLGYIVREKLNLEARFLFSSSLTRKLSTQKWKTKISPDEDLAIIVLKQPIENDLYVFKPLSDREIQQIKSKIHNYTPSIVTINFVAEMSLDTKRAATLDQFKSSGARSWSSKSRSRLDPGDSGSPLFVRTGQEWKLIGVSKGQAKNLFSDWDVFASFEGNLCEISRLNQLNLCH